MRHQVATHDSKDSGAIVVIYPGLNGDIDGFNDKYIKIANMLSDYGIAAVIRTDNHEVTGVDYNEFVLTHLREVIDYALGLAELICGTSTPRLYLMGVSAGASASAAVLQEFPQIERALLVAPDGRNFKRALESVANYKGELYITVGSDDENVGTDASEKLHESAVNASVNKLVIVPDCDHQFRGEVNGMIFSKAPLWAFAGDETYPAPKGGVKLYD